MVMLEEALADVTRLREGMAGLRLVIASNQRAIAAWGTDSRRQIVRSQAEARVRKAQAELAVLVAEAEKVTAHHD